jgi:hypothetical protein
MSWSHIIVGGVFGVVAIVMVVAFFAPKRTGGCPDGYVLIYRTSGAPACAAYVVEPVR